MYRCYIVTLYTAYTASQLRLGVGSPLRVHAWRGREMKEQKSVLGLSTIRRNRGVSLEQIAESTKISIRSLEAIEQGDFRKLPGGIYNTSYIRQYARAIEYDESALLDFYTREMAGSDGTVRNGANGNGGDGGVRPAPPHNGSQPVGGGPPGAHRTLFSPKRHRFHPYQQADGGVDRGPGVRPTIPAQRFSPRPCQPIPPAPWIPCTPYAWSERAYASFSASRVANLATLMMARSCVPSPIFSFSSRASTRNSTRRPSTRMTSAVNVTLIPIGVAARCATLTCVATVS